MHWGLSAARRAKTLWAVALLVPAVVAGACGGSGGGGQVSKAEWTGAHSAAVASVNQELALATQTLNVGDRAGILAACGLLVGDVPAARKGLPVPNAAADAALRTGLDAAATAGADCLHGAQVATSASLNEKAMRELASATSLMAAANQALAAWQ
ncbi:MAG: hypothetical protein ACRDYC_14055 [Acidimicrobiales bacterium]